MLKMASHSSFANCIYQTHFDFLFLFLFYFLFYLFYLCIHQNLPVMVPATPSGFRTPFHTATGSTLKPIIKTGDLSKYPLSNLHKLCLDHTYKLLV